MCVYMLQCAINRVSGRERNECLELECQTELFTFLLSSSSLISNGCRLKEKFDQSDINGSYYTASLYLNGPYKLKLHEHGVVSNIYERIPLDD